MEVSHWVDNSLKLFLKILVEVDELMVVRNIPTDVNMDGEGVFIQIELPSLMVEFS